MEIGKNMMLLTTYWGDDKTFKMMPVTEDCPFMEVIYDPKTNLLVVITKNMKENLQLVPKVDDDGNSIPTKRPKSNGKPWKEKHVQMTVPQEFYFIEKTEQELFIKQFAINASTYDYMLYLDAKESQIIQSEQPGLIDKTGQPLKSKKKGNVISMPDPIPEVK